ncbi:MAG: hypothetical protein PHU77_00105 [Simplicispira sp.]|nr:hypothetical protein [Simplicispira sp.]
MTNPWEKYQASAVDSDADSGPWSAYAPVDAEPAPTRSLARSAGDSAIALGTGAVQGVKMLTDVAGAGNAASRALGTAADALTDLESPYRKAQKQERAAKIKTAEASGSTWEEVKAHAGAFADAPIDTTLNALGTSLPTLAVAAVPGLGQAALATRAAQAGVGVAQGVGNIKGQVHEAVKQKHLEAGSAEEEATRRADAAQAYGGDNAGAIALGGALGGLAGSTGAESVVRRLAGRQIAGEAVERAAPGLIRSAATGVVKEAPMEAAQGGQERLASNVALQGEGFDVPTWQGVAGQAALEGLAAAPMGGGFGAAEGMRGRALQRADTQARQNAEAAAADAQAKADAIIPPWSTQPGAADPNAAGATGVASAANAPAVADANFTTSPGAGSLRQDGIDYQRDVDTSGLSLQDSAEATTQQLGYSPLAGTPTVFPDGSVALGSEAEFAHRYAPQPMKRSESMGIDPAAGPLSKSAALAVDSGAYMPPAGQAPVAEPEPDPVVLQNRDRTSAASIAQMQEIAANPDYLRVGPSRDMTSGAPIVFGELPPTALLGRPETVVDGRGERMGTQYAVVDAGDLIASNNADGTAVAEYASGAPGKLRSVAGNGRTAGLQAAYQLGTAQRYRQELVGDAAALGVDAQALAAMQRPVLVRVMQGADVTRDMGDRTNITTTQKLSPLEQAGNDARRLDVRTLSFDEGGNPTPDSIKGFVSAMPVAERGDMLNPDGTPTRQAVDRLMAATFKQAYESDELVQLYAQASDPDARAVMAAAADASGVLANLKGTGEFDVRAAVAGAAKMAVNAARQGMKLSDVLQNQDMDMHPEAFPVAAYLAQHIRTPKRMAEGLRRWGQLALEQARIADENTRQGSLLGPRPTLTRAEIFARLGSEDNPAGQSVAPAPTQGVPAAEPLDKSADKSQPLSNALSQSNAAVSAQSTAAQAQAAIDNVASQSPSIQSNPNGEPNGTQADQAQQATPQQPETPAPSAVDRHPTWRHNAIQAGRVARDLGLEPKGKRLAQIVAEIDARDSEQNQPPAQAQQEQAATENVANAASPAALDLTAPTPADIESQQQAQEQTAKTEATRKRTDAAAAQAGDDRKRIAVASVDAADSFELGQDPLDSLTGQGGLMFSRAGETESERQLKETEIAYGGRDAYGRAKEAGRTKLTYGQWVQVRTPNFKAWFGDWEGDPAAASKVVDADTGEPMVVYHGTNADFSAFRVSEGMYGTGVYLAKLPEYASGFADSDGANVMPVFANIRGRLDGNILPGKRGGIFVAFSPEQVKSATGNNGAFDPANPDIRFSRAGAETASTMSPDLARTILALGRPPARATKESVRAAVRELVNGLGLLPNSLGRIVVATSAEIKQDWEPLIGAVAMESEDAGRAQGFYDPKTKTVFVIADHIRQGDELGVVAHELMHKHGPAVLGKEGWNQLHGAIGGWAKAKTGTMERIVYDEAARRVRASGPELSNQELFPYAVQVALEMGVKPNAMAPQGTVARWLAQVRSALRQAWSKIAGGKGDFNSLDLVNLAFGIAQRENPAHAGELDNAIEEWRDAGAAKDQTQTEAFRRWFGDSKVVDAQGKPLVVYHGTAKAFNKVNMKKGAQGIFWVTSDRTAIENREVGAQGEGAIMELYARIEKPAGWKEYNNLSMSEIRSRGFDGVMLPQGDGTFIAIILDPAQVKSATGNNGRFDPGNADIRFSRAMPTAIESSMGAMTPAQEAAYKNVAGVQKVPTLKERAAAMKANLGLRMKQALVDQFAPIRDVSQHAYMMARMSKASDGAMDALLLYGKPFLRDGVLDVNINDGGFAKMLAGLKGEHDRFFMWVAAQRGERLKAEGKENLMGDADISALKTLNAGKMADGTVRLPLYAKALRELNDFNESALKVALESGLIDQAAYDLMKDQPYVPFYRLMAEEGGMTGPKFSSGLLNQKAWKKLKGGTQQLNADLVQNSLQNWSHLYAASARNRAALATMDAAETMGVAYKVQAETKGSVKVMRAGMTEHWMVEDPYLLEAVSALNYTASPLMKPLAKAKSLLTFGVTVNPTFKIRNLIRDSLSAISQSELGYNPLANVGHGWKLTASDSQMYASMLASGGVIKFGTQENTDRLRDKVAKLGGVVLDQNGLQKFTGQLKELYDVYAEFGDRTENVNRAALYDQLIKKGHSHAEASFMARDLMDFSMGGSHPAVRFLTQTVPFLNARLQGLYKLGRAANENPRRFATMAAAVSLASLALLAAYGDDEDWKKREDWDRDAYWWFKVGGTAFRIPKPFELGAIGTIAERTAEAMFDEEMTGKRFMQRIGHMAGQTFSLDPVPQAFKPLLDVYANKDSFTGRAIESQADQRLRPQDRYSERTSEVARLLGGLGLPDPGRLVKGDYAALSPKQVDHLIRGYFSWLGVTTATVSDFALRPAMDRGDRPDMRLRDVFIAGNFAESLPTGSSRYVSQLYEQSRSVEQAFASYREAIKTGDMDKAAQIQESEGPKLRNRMAYANATKQLSEINAQAKRIEANRLLPGDVKRERLTELELRRGQVAKRLSDMGVS